MFLFKLTLFGWVMLFILFFSLITGYKMAGIWFKGKDRYFITAFIFLVLACLNLLFIFFGLSVAEVNVRLVKGKPYRGVIIGSKTYSGRSSFSRSNIIFYAPVIRFTDDKGKLIDLETDIRSSNPPKIGEKMNIVYTPNYIGQNNEAKGWLFKIAGSIFVILLGFVSYKATKYAYTTKPQNTHIYNKW